MIINFCATGIINIIYNKLIKAEGWDAASIQLGGCFAFDSHRVRITPPALSIPGLSQNLKKQILSVLRVAACRKLDKLASQRMRAVPYGLVAISYSPSAHTSEETDLNLHLPHLGLPTSIPYFIVSLPIITALFNIYWGRERRVMGGQVR